MRKFAMLPIVVVMVGALAAPSLAGTSASADQGQAKGSPQAESKSPGSAQEKAPAAAPAKDPASGAAPGGMPGSAPAPDQTSAPSDPAQAAVEAQAKADAEAKLEARKKLDRIKERGAKVSAEARAKAESQLSTVSARTGEDAARYGSTTIATRLAGEFGMTTDQLMAEHQSIGCSWGDQMIAHSLHANARTEASVAQLLQLRREGTGWGQIAAGLGLKLGQVVSAVQAEGRVASGLSKPDGKVATIRGDGTRASVNAGTGVKAGAPAGGVSATAQSGVGVGVKVKP